MPDQPSLPISLDEVLKLVDKPWLLENTERLWKVERGACFRHWHQSSALAEQMLRDLRLQQVQRIAHPADGKTAYYDRIMPIAWDVTRATLTVKRPAAYDNPVVASYERHPFHVVKGSTGTPPEGILTRLISEQQLYSGEDPRGAMVLLEPDTYPRSPMLNGILDLGVIGFVDTNLTGRFDTPDGLSWPNATTEGSHWHVTADERPFIGFVVSPREGERLRTGIRQGGINVHVYSDARRYVGEWHTVTGVIPGEDPREMWLMAHLYEPMPDDNSSGVIGSMEVIRVLRKLMDAGRLPRPRFTLRIVLTAEMYGYAAYAAGRGLPLRDKVIGAVNFDGMLANMPGRLYLAPPDSPFCGDYLMEQGLDEYQNLNLSPPIRLFEEGMYGDDQFLNDPTGGISTVWLIGGYKWWHNSSQTMDIINPDSFARNVGFYALWMGRMLNLRAPERSLTMGRAGQIAERHVMREAAKILQKATGADADGRRDIARRAPTWMQWRLERELGRLKDFERVWDGGAEFQTVIDRLRRHTQEQQQGLMKALEELVPKSAAPVVATIEPVRDVWAAGMVPKRLAPVQPYDQANLPFNERPDLPGAVIYGIFSDVLAHMDGKRTLKELIEYTEWVHDRTLSPHDVRGYISAVAHLAEHGQLGLTQPPGITRQQIVQTLRGLGVREGDLVLVHSKMSAFGHVEGGAETIVDAFIEAVGPKGTLLMPTFTQSAFYVNGQSWANPNIRPFNVDKVQIWVGQVPGAFLKRGKAAGVVRSVHPTHSAAGRGPLAEACLAPHGESDSPTGSTSPFAKLVEHRGKMIWFGADLGAATFLHYLEDVLDLPYLQPAIGRVERKDGRIDSVFMPRHLPGCRDFYRSPGETTKVYERMIAKGLEIREAKLGLGKVRAIDAVQMNELGLAVIKADPWVLLCDRPECLFCRGYNPLP